MNARETQRHKPDDFVGSLEAEDQRKGIHKGIFGTPFLPPEEIEGFLGWNGGINTSLPPPYEAPRTIRRFFASQPSFLLSAIVMLSITLWALTVFATLSSYASDDHLSPPSIPPWTINLDCTFNLLGR
jgi:hypothetical protein